MKTLKLEYTLDNIQKAFHHFAKYNNDSSNSFRQFSIETDTVTIVDRAYNCESFVNLLCYDYSECDRLIITVYDQYAKDSIKYVFDMTAARKRCDNAEENKRLKVEIADLQEANRLLARELNEEKDKQLFEKITDVKTVDAGDTIVLFIPKVQIDQVLREEIEQAKSSLSSMELLYRFFRRFMFNPKKS